MMPYTMTSQHAVPMGPPKGISDMAIAADAIRNI